MSQLTAIVAMTSDRVIGRNGDLPWHLPEDLKFFKHTTSGHPIVMGRRTFDSIGRPLPKRQNIVLTRDENWQKEGVHVIHEPSALSDVATGDDEIFIIGGSEIYRAFLPHLDSIIVSHVLGDYEGDTFFPAFEHDFPVATELETHDDFIVRRHSRRCAAE